MPRVALLREQVATLSEQVAALQALAAKRMMPSFDDDADSQDVEIALAVQEVTELFKESEALLREVRSAPSGASDGAVRQNIERAIAQQLHDLSHEFRRGHRAYQQALKGQQIDDFLPDYEGALRPRAKPAACGAPAASFFDDDATGPPELAGQRQMLELVVADQQVEARGRAIAQVAESVAELAEIFREIHVLVIEQGTVIDRIDYNIEQAAHNVVRARKEVERADKLQQDASCLIS